MILAFPKPAPKPHQNFSTRVAGNSVSVNPANIVATTPNRRRKSMSTRSGQNGTVVRKGQMWHGRYYVDDPSTEKRRRASLPIGPVKEVTKTEAKRKLRTMLERMGLNDDAHLDRLETDVKTFASMAEWWRENKLSVFKPSSQE